MRRFASDTKNNATTDVNQTPWQRLNNQHALLKSTFQWITIVHLIPPR
jgi:hypothetical protein